MQAMIMKTELYLKCKPMLQKIFSGYLSVLKKFMTMVSEKEMI